jgi:hypothetical protein
MAEQTKTNYTPTWLLIIGVPLAVVGAIMWGVAWNHADLAVFTASLYGTRKTHWTAGVIAGIATLAVGALLSVAGLIGLAVRR